MHTKILSMQGLSPFYGRGYPPTISPYVCWYQKAFYGGGTSPEAPEALVKRFKTGIQNFGLISYPKPEEFYGGGNPPENWTTSQAFYGGVNVPRGPRKHI